jgi:hypothetical protein
MLFPNFGWFWAAYSRQGPIRRLSQAEFMKNEPLANVNHAVEAINSAVFALRWH